MNFSKLSKENYYNLLNCDMLSDLCLRQVGENVCKQSTFLLIVENPD